MLLLFVRVWCRFQQFFSHITTVSGCDRVGWLCWGLTSQSTIFQSCRDGAIASWVINQYFRGVKCLAQGHNTAAVGLEPRTSRSGVRHSTTEPPRSPGCDRELNAHFYSVASLKYHAPDIWHDTTPSHIIMTLEWPVPALPPNVWVPSEEQLVPFLMALVCRGLGLNLWPPVPRNGHSTDWSTGASSLYNGEVIPKQYKCRIKHS